VSVSKESDTKNATLRIVSQFRVGFSVVFLVLFFDRKFENPTLIPTLLLKPTLDSVGYSVG
jgi:hypothetical protein